MKLLLPLFGISMCFLVSCGGTRSNDEVIATADTLSIALNQIVNNTILPTVEGFAQTSARFNDTAVSFCSAPDSNSLVDLQNSWRVLSTQWYKLEVYNFGPLNDDIIFPRINFIDPLRQRGINYTETVRTEISNGVTGSNELNLAFFETRDFNRVGILALELLAFETTDAEHSTNTEVVLAEYQATPRKCEYLQGMAAFNLQLANTVRDGWQVNSLNTGTPFRTVFVQEELPDGTQPVPALLISLQEHLDYLSRRNVAMVGAQVADYSFENIRSSVDEISAILNGNSTESDTIAVSFFDIMRSAGAQNSIAIVEDNISAIYLAIENRNVTQLNASLALLDGNFKREITQGLDVALGINFTDGD